MWFRNLQVFRFRGTMTVDALKSDLAANQLLTCSAGDFQSIGWVPPCADFSLVHAVNRQWLIALGVEEKLLPASVVKQTANERAKAIESAEGRRVGRKEMRDLRDSVAADLLPRAFVRLRVTFGWIDPVNGWLVVDSSSTAKAEELLEHLRKSVSGLPVSLLKMQLSPSSAMTAWMAEGEAPGPFSIDQDADLHSAEHAEVRYVRHTLDADEIRQHIAAGKKVTRLALTWKDRVSFVLDDRLQIKRLSFLDIVKEQADGQAENEEERFDIDFTLMTGEVAQLLGDLVAALGGEPVEMPR